MDELVALHNIPAPPPPPPEAYRPASPTPLPESYRPIPAQPQQAAVEAGEGRAAGEPQLAAGPSAPHAQQAQQQQQPDAAPVSAGDPPAQEADAQSAAPPAVAPASNAQPAAAAAADAAAPSAPAADTKHPEAAGAQLHPLAILSEVYVLRQAVPAAPGAAETAGGMARLRPGPIMRLQVTVEGQEQLCLGVFEVRVCCSWVKGGSEGCCCARWEGGGLCGVQRAGRTSMLKGNGC